MPSQQTKRTMMECPDSDANVACHSFQELLVAKDADLMGTLRCCQTFICFRPKEDVFLLLRGSEPEEGLWEKNEKFAAFTYMSAIELLRFKNGIFDHGGESAFARGQWRSSDKTPGTASFTGESISEGNSKGQIDVEGATVTVSHSFENRNGSNTLYSFKLQKSTGRFTETFAAPNFPDNQVAGRCLNWNPKP
jgi:hypothetical protein